MSVHHTLIQFLADVPNPAPQDPTGGSKGVDLLLSYVKWGALIGCAIAALASGGIMGIGKLSDRPGAAEKGRTALIWSVAGVVVTAVAIPLVNTVFGAAN